LHCCLTTTHSVCGPPVVQSLLHIVTPITYSPRIQTSSSPLPYPRFPSTPPYLLHHPAFRSRSVTSLRHPDTHPSHSPSVFSAFHLEPSPPPPPDTHQRYNFYRFSYHRYFGLSVGRMRTRRYWLLYSFTNLEPLPQSCLSILFIYASTSPLPLSQWTGFVPYRVWLLAVVSRPKTRPSLGPPIVLKLLRCNADVFRVSVNIDYYSFYRPEDHSKKSS